MKIEPLFSRFGLCILACLFAHTAFAQANFQPGYISLNSGETLNGFVDYRPWRDSPTEIAFKASKNAEVQVFSPLEAQGFGLSDEVIYQSAIVQSASSPRETEHLPDNPDPVLSTDTVFLEVLISGPKSLFRHRNRFKNENFYILNDGRHEWLSFKKFLAKDGPNTFSAETRGYVKQLGQYLSGCAEVEEMLEETRHERKSLVALFKAWYGCQTAPPTFESNNYGIKLHAGVFGGAIMTDIGFGGDEIYDYLYEGTKSPSFNLTGGIYLDFAEGDYMSRWSLHNEFAWAAYELNVDFEEYISENNHQVYASRIRYGYVRMANMVRRQFRKGDQAFFFNAGVVTGLAIVAEHRRDRTRTSYGVTRGYNDPLFEQPRKMEVGVAAGLGYRIKGFGAELRYEMGNGMSSSVGLRTSTRRIQFLLSFGI